MDRNSYSVEDILEEVKRKRAREMSAGAPPRDGYGAGNPADREDGALVRGAPREAVPPPSNSRPYGRENLTAVPPHEPDRYPPQPPPGYGGSYEGMRYGEDVRPQPQVQDRSYGGYPYPHPAPQEMDDRYGAAVPPYRAPQEERANYAPPDRGGYGGAERWDYRQDSAPPRGPQRPVEPPQRTMRQQPAPESLRYGSGNYDANRTYEPYGSSESQNRGYDSAPLGYPEPRTPYGSSGTGRAAGSTQYEARQNPYGGRGASRPAYERPEEPGYSNSASAYPRGYSNSAPPPSNKTYESSRPASIRSAASSGAPLPPPPKTVQPISRRTPKPSMDDLLQNFGEGVGLGKGIDPSRPTVQPRRTAPVVGQGERPPQADASYPRIDAPLTGAPSAQGSSFSFNFKLNAPADTRYVHPEDPAVVPPDYASGYDGAYMAQEPQGYAPQESTRMSAPAGVYMPSAPFERLPENPYGQQQDNLEQQYPDPMQSAAASPQELYEDIQPMQATPPEEFDADLQPYMPSAAPAAELGPEPVDTKAIPDFGDAPFDPEATRVADPIGTDEPYGMRFQASGHIPLAAEDIGDDPDFDEDGNPLDLRNSEQERQNIVADIKRVRSGLKIRFLLTCGAFVGLLYLALSIIIKIPLPPFMFPEKAETVRTFIIVNAAVTAVTLFINSPIIGGGLVSLFTLKADNDSLISLAMIASVAHGVALIITPESLYDAGVHLYYCVPVFGLLFNLLGKMMMMKRIAVNSKIVCGEGDKCVMRTIQSEDFSRELSRGLPAELPEITYSVKSGNVCGYLRASYAQDYAESLNRILALVCLAACITVASLTYFFTEARSVYVALTVLSGLLSVCAPFTATLVGNMPMLRAAQKLQRVGAAITGYPVVEEYNAVKAVTFKVKELFPEESISLISMKVFQESLIERAISDVVSVITQTDSPLAPVFQGMVQGEKILKTADNIVYEDGMGLSAWVDGKRVLLGNAQLMLNHGVATPSRDYEQRYAGEGSDILYLSNSGELIAMFALRYQADPRVASQLSELADAGVCLIVHSTDPNISPKRLAALYSYPESYIRIVPASLHADYDRVVAPRNRVQASIVYTGSIMTMFRALGIIPRIKSAVTSATACQLLAILIGYAVITFFAFFAGMIHVTFWALLFYQLAWTAVVMAVSNMRKI